MRTIWMGLIVALWPGWLGAQTTNWCSGAWAGNDYSEIVIDSSTVANCPSEMMRSDLMLNSSNTLLLTNAGTQTPLQIGNLEAQSGSQIFVYGSALWTSNWASGGTLNLFSGQCRLDAVSLVVGSFVQTGGDAVIGSFNLLYESELDGGNLSIGALVLNSQEGGSQFRQSGGTNSIGSLSDEGQAENSFVMTGGVLNIGSISLVPGLGDTAQFEQSNATVIVSNEIYLAGSAYHYPWLGVPATYSLANGTLFGQSLVLDSAQGGADFSVNNSLASFSGNIDVVGSTWAPSSIVLESGTLACSNLINGGGACRISQSGGAFVVTNLLMIDGYYPVPYDHPTGHIVYSFDGGTLSAGSIYVGSEFSIGGAAQAGRICNPGTFELSGILDIGDDSEQLGALIVESSTNYQLDSFSGEPTTNLAMSNALIVFTGGNARLSFANSSSQNWSNGVPLLVSNWNGSLAGGGEEQLKFGGDMTGLRADELAQVQFINPVGLPSGAYPPRILGTGEVVPDAPGWVQLLSSGASLVLSWSPGMRLQWASNVAGPYNDLPDATSPYTNSVAQFPQEYFRLRQ